MSAARAAARVKPVIAIKAGRFVEGARAAASHTGALAGVDAVYDAAFARAGILRVRDVEELFGAVETLGLVRGVSGERSEEHTSELQSLMRISYTVFCLKKKTEDTPTRESK